MRHENARKIKAHRKRKPNQSPRFFFVMRDSILSSTKRTNNQILRNGFRFANPKKGAGKSRCIPPNLNQGEINKQTTVDGCGMENNSFAAAGVKQSIPTNLTMPIRGVRAADWSGFAGREALGGSLKNFDGLAAKSL